MPGRSASFVVAFQPTKDTKHQLDCLERGASFGLVSYSQTLKMNPVYPTYLSKLTVANTKILRKLENCFVTGGNSPGSGQSNGSTVMEKITALLEMPRAGSEIIEAMRSWQFFEVSVDLVPWSFGLSLVRFEEVSSNRRLEIIRG